METKVQKWGNSLALRIPKALAEETHITQDMTVTLTVEDGVIVIKPVTRRRYSLEELVAQVTEENIHSEIDMGPSMGNEGW